MRSYCILLGTNIRIMNMGIILGVALLQSKAVSIYSTINFDWKGISNMNDDIKIYVLNLLETCQERKRKIALLHYELEHPAQTSEAEMISAMALGHGTGGNNGGHTESYISDKTLYIALNYQSKVDKVNADTKEEIVVQLVELEQEQRRLDYYISLLNERQAKVLQSFYERRLSQSEVEKLMGLSAKTVRKLKKEALDALVRMYKFISDFS